VVDKPAQAEEHDENDLIAAPNRAESDSVASGARQGIGRAGAPIAPTVTEGDGDRCRCARDVRGQASPLAPDRR
jgi:hypothetical protein